MKMKTGIYAILIGAVVLGSPGMGRIFAREHATRPAFKFVGGTKLLPERCEGKLEMNSDSMTFACDDGSVRVPYTSILFMQYRTDISKKVRRMKPRWIVKPDLVTPLLSGKANRYFTVVYRESKGPADTLVLEVSPDDMRPYLAEIDVKVGHRVEVEDLDD
jgi:hypothetical protein